MDANVKDAVCEASAWWEATDERWREILLLNLALEARGGEAAPTANTWVTPADRYRAVVGAAFETPASVPSDEVRRLRKVDCYGTAVEDLSPLAQLEALREAYCGATPVAVLEPLQNCTRLEKLCLYNTPVSNLEPLRNLQNLRRLCCANTRVRSLEPLSRLEQLEVLSISNTVISSLTPIGGLMRLRRLRCANTAVSSEELEAFRREHPLCEVLTIESDEDDFAVTLGELSL
jgi:Leucine-rich repeat (LRR) protein